jgi:lanthanide-dependent methanol dehydrogenase
MRHSKLTDIDAGSVNRLQLIWSQSSSAMRGHEGQPLVINDVHGKPMMYFESTWPNIVQALDLSDPDHPKQAWNYDRQADRDESAVPAACCDTVNRAVSYADGKVVFATLDGFIIALDALTGQEIWAVKHAHPDHGETVTSPPIIADDKVIAGISGDEFAARARLVAYDLKSGREVWTCQIRGADQDVCATAEATATGNLQTAAYGGESVDLTGSKAESKFGGLPWEWYSYDPELRILYALAAKRGHGSQSYRCGANDAQGCNSGRWEGKSSMMIYARRIDTGKVIWARQMTPLDESNHDGVNENILVDMIVDGISRKCVVHFDRNGFAFVLDRTDGTVLRGDGMQALDVPESIAGRTTQQPKIPVESPTARRDGAACASALGGTDHQPCALDPADPSKFYCPTNNWCREDEPQELPHIERGSVYVVANVRMYPQNPGTTGKFKKLDVLTGASEWEIPDSYPNWGGALVTDGGLVFYGSLSGDFRAVERNSGKIVWHRKLGLGIVGDPVTYEVKGRQYISVWSGVGRWIRLPGPVGLDLSDEYGAIDSKNAANAAEYKKMPQGGTLYTFRLQD